MTERVETLVSNIREMASRVGAEFVPDDAKIIVFRKAGSRGLSKLPAPSV